jgi:hypothetical protein
MSAHTYLLRTLIFALLIAGAVVTINYLVDPYGITGVDRMPGFNEYKVEINEHTRVMKKYQPVFHPSNTLIVGNSRVEMGIAPSHTCFSSNNMAAYNLGIPGADVRTQLAYALNVMYQQPIETVFLSVDFTDFIASHQKPLDHVRASGPTAHSDLKFLSSGERNSEYLQVVFKDYLKSLFSLDALIASVKTIALQSRVAPDRDNAGFNPARDFGHAVSVEGPYALFDQKMTELRGKYSRPWFLRDAQGELNPAFAEIDAFLGIAAERGVKVFIFTNPFHDSFWQLMRSQGHMPAYEDWMQSMESLVRAHPDAQIEFWDFSRDSAYIHEPVPAAGVRSGPLQWFWEPAHYRRELGDIMVSAMFGDRCDENVSFGRQIF